MINNNRYVLSLSLLITLISCKSDIEKKIEYNSSVKENVSKILKENNFNYNSLLFNYNTPLLIKYFEDDSLTLNTYKQDQKLIFKSTHKKEDNIITMKGTYGLFGGYGYTIKIDKENVEVFYTVNSDGTPKPYTLSQNGDLTNFILVPVKKFDLKLSAKPTGQFSEVIYGFIEFESNDYYKMDYQELHRLQKINTNMKIYFKSLAVK